MRNRQFLLNEDTYHLAPLPPLLNVLNIKKCLGWNQDGDCSAETRLEGSHISDLISDQELEFMDN